MFQFQLGEKVSYGKGRDQHVKVKKILDRNGNFLYEGNVYFRKTMQVKANTTICGNAELPGLSALSDFEVRNIHKIRKYHAVCVGMPSKESTDYIYLGKKNMTHSYVQMEFLERNDRSATRYAHQGITTKKERIFYMEFTLHAGVCTLGLAPAKYNYAGIGWYNNSIGFHGDNGGIYNNNNEYSSMIGRFNHEGGGCVIGVGWNYTTGKVFFTKNGERFPEKSGEKWVRRKSGLTEALFPTIGFLNGAVKDYGEHGSYESAVSFSINNGSDTSKTPFLYKELNSVDAPQKNEETGTWRSMFGSFFGRKKKKKKKEPKLRSSSLSSSSSSLSSSSLSSSSSRTPSRTTTSRIPSRTRIRTEERVSIAFPSGTFHFRMSDSETTVLESYQRAAGNFNIKEMKLTSPTSNHQHFYLNVSGTNGTLQQLRIPPTPTSSSGQPYKITETSETTITRSQPPPPPQQQQQRRNTTTTTTPTTTTVIAEEGDSNKLLSFLKRNRLEGYYKVMVDDGVEYENLWFFVEDPDSVDMYITKSFHKRMFIRGIKTEFPK